MIRSAMYPLFAAIALLSAAAPAVAEDLLHLTFDGVTRDFVVQQHGGQTGFTRFLSVDAVGIEGVAAETDGAARLVLEIALPPGARAGDQPHDARIIYRPDGFRDYWVSPPGFPAHGLRVEDLDLSGPAPRISGHFEVPLCFTPSPVHAPGRCLSASGRFDTALTAD